MIRLRRVYEPPEPRDGYRILVERLWPRGLSKEKIRIDLWTKDAAPSPGLRTWYAHDPAKWAEFRRRYRAELRRNPEVGRLRAIVREKKNVTFVFAARDEERNSARVLAAFLGEEAAGAGRLATTRTRTRMRRPRKR